MPQTQKQVLKTNTPTQNLYAFSEHGQPVKFDHALISYQTPETAASVALSTRTHHKSRVDFARRTYLKYGNNGSNRSANKLLSILKRQEEAHYKLSSIGYTNFRHLQAEGITLAEIANDFDMNLLDIMAYMSAHPNALNDAEMDALACADAKIRDFLTDLKNTPPRTKFEADRRNVEYKVLLEQVRRISATWASYAPKPDDDVSKKSAFQLNVTLGTPGTTSTVALDESGVQVTLDTQGAGTVDPNSLLGRNNPNPKKQNNIIDVTPNQDEEFIPDLAVAEDFINKNTTLQNVTQQIAPNKTGPQTIKESLSSIYYGAAPDIDEDGMYLDPLTRGNPNIVSAKKGSDLTQDPGVDFDD